MSGKGQFYKLIVLLVLSGYLVIGLSHDIYSQELLQQKNIEMAQEALQGYVNNYLTEKNFDRFGFKSLREAMAAQVGDPYHVMFISLRELNEYKSGTDAEALLRDAKIKWFPVIVENEVRTKLEMVEKEGRWYPGEFGGIQTVRVITEAKKKLPRLLEGMDLEEKPRVTLVKIPAMYAVFLHAEVSEGDYLLPAMIQPQRFELSSEQLYPADEILLKLKDFAKEIDPNKLM